MILAFCLALGAAPTPITVLYFDNNSGDKTYDALGKGLADMMITDLSSVPALSVVERDKLEAILKEQKLQRSKYFDPKTAQRIGKLAGAQLAVAGAFAAIEPDVRIDVRVVSIESGQVLTATKVSGKKTAFFALQEQLAAALAKGLSEALGGAKVAVKAAPGPKTIGDARTYATSLDRKDAGELKEAGDALQQVVAADPTFALAQKRYVEVMRELSAARSLRSAHMLAVEKRLLSTLDPAAEQELDPSYEIPDTQYGHMERTLVRGDLYLRRVADALSRSATKDRYVADLELYLDNTERLLDTIDARDLRGKNSVRRQGYQCPNGGYVCLDEEERDAMEALGLKLPLDEPRRVMVHQLALDAANVMMHGEAPAYAGWKLPRAVCLYKLDPRYPRRAFELYDLAERSITEYPEDRYELWQKDVPNVGATIALWRARTHDRVGERDKAIAALQTAMRKYPETKIFGTLEDGVEALAAGRALVPPCEAPK
jgi:TolB-like protein